MQLPVQLFFHSCGIFYMRRHPAFRVLGFICRILGFLGFDLLGGLRMHVIHTKKAKHHHSCSRFACDCYDRILTNSSMFRLVVQ